MKFWLPNERQRTIWLPGGKDGTLRALKHSEALNKSNPEFIWLRGLADELSFHDQYICLLVENIKFGTTKMLM